MPCQRRVEKLREGEREKRIDLVAGWGEVLGGWVWIVGCGKELKGESAEIVEALKEMGVCVSMCVHNSNSSYPEVAQVPLHEGEDGRDDGAGHRRELLALP